jgi:hypothetical protein
MNFGDLLNKILKESNFVSDLTRYKEPDAVNSPMGISCVNNGLAVTIRNPENREDGQRNSLNPEKHVSK